MCHNSPSPSELELAQARKCASLQAHCIYREGWLGLIVGFYYNKLSVHYIYSKGYTLLIVSFGIISALLSNII